MSWQQAHPVLVWAGSTIDLTIIHIFLLSRRLGLLRLSAPTGLLRTGRDSQAHGALYQPCLRIRSTNSSLALKNFTEIHAGVMPSMHSLLMKSLGGSCASGERWDVEKLHCNSFSFIYRLLPPGLPPSFHSFCLVLLPITTCYSPSILRAKS